MMDEDNFEKVMAPFIGKPYVEFTFEYSQRESLRTVTVKCYSAQYVKMLRAKITRLENKIRELESRQ